ncbi:hypothetical protein SEA_ZUKO_98 [Streptomyces phage Zuko]|uniref:Uncharacterized protein n=1 Tax=Streptomyces phage Zuko TaxID=2601695 RepID=A0A5J6D861_9CAUD|nr:hypothetical protein PP630_gp098 [Streptomyces phage Zuko]QEQ93676.1 hypothetical protein SEA_ZUKO_98 [Streptomyces phage Zuko]
MSRETAAAKFISLAAELVRPDMSQDDYDKLQTVAALLNPRGGIFGFQNKLNESVAAVAPEIKLIPAPAIQYDN